MKFNKKIILIIIVIICILCIGVLAIKIFSNAKNIENTEIYNMHQDEINNLITYIPYSYIGWKEYDDAYCGKKVTNMDVIESIVVPSYLNAYVKNYNNEDENTTHKEEKDRQNTYLTSEINNYLTKRYNLVIGDVVKKHPNTIINDEYTTITFKKSNTYSVIIKSIIGAVEAYASNSSAIITEKTVFYELKDDKYYIYKNTSTTDEDNILKVYNKVDNDGKELSYGDIFYMIKEDFKDYNYGFKHTYKKNDTGYYWYSTEFVEIK